MNYLVACGRVSKQPKLLTMYFVLIHCFELILNVSPNDILIRVANRLNKITLGPKLLPQKYCFLISERQLKNSRAEMLFITCITFDGDVFGSEFTTIWI
jgi:hypothetical protein